MRIFGFFGKKEIVKKYEAAAPAGPVNVKETEVADWVKKEFSGSITLATKSMLDVQGEVLNNFDDIKKNANALKNAEFEPGDRIYAQVNMAKSSFVNGVYSNLKRLPEPAATYSGALGFSKFARVLIAEMARVPPKQGILVSRYFRSEAEAFADSIRKAEESINSLGTVMSGEAKILNVSEEADRRCDIIDKKRSELADKKNALSLIDKKIVLTEGGRAGSHAELERVLNSAELAEMYKIRKEIENYRDEAEKILSDINGELCEIKRPLGKLEHSGVRDIAKLAKSPAKAFIEGFDIGPALEKLQSAVTEGKLKLKENEKQKVMKADASRLRQMMEKRQELLKKAGELEERLETGFSEALESRRKAEEAVRQASELLEKLKKEKEDCIKAAQVLEEEIKKEIAILQEFVSSGTGRNISIT